MNRHCPKIDKCRELIGYVVRNEISEKDRENIYSIICEDIPYLCEHNLRGKS